MMRKILVLVILFALTTTTTTFAQFELGVRGGFNFATFSALPNGVDNDGARIGIHLGAYSRFQLPQGIYLQPELLISQKGGKLAIPAINRSFTTKITTIDLPIIVGYNLKPVRLGLGPVIGFVISARSESGGRTDDVLDDTNKTLMGLQIGVGFDPIEKLGVDLRYEVGLTKLSNRIADDNTKTNVIQLTVSYRLK